MSTLLANLRADFSGDQDADVIRRARAVLGDGRRSSEAVLQSEALAARVRIQPLPTPTRSATSRTFGKAPRGAGTEPVRDLELNMGKLREKMEQDLELGSYARSTRYVYISAITERQALVQASAASRLLAGAWRCALPSRG